MVRRFSHKLKENSIQEGEDIMSKIKVGIFTPIDFKAKGNLEKNLKLESRVIGILRKQGIEVIRGGDQFPKENQLAWNPQLVHSHIERIAKERPDALIINEVDWTLPYDSVDAINIFQQETKDIARTVIFSYKTPEIAGLVTGMAIAGGLKEIGASYQLCYGAIDKDPQVLQELMNILQFYKRRSEAKETVKSAIEKLSKQKYLSFGGMSLRIITGTADIEQWQKLFGISYEALDQSEIKVRALKLVRWESQPGESDYEIVDSRVKKAVDFLYKKGHGKFDFSRKTLPSINKLLYQISLYYAALDICSEYGITFAGVKCQTEMTFHECSACLLTSYLNNDVGPEGEAKKIIPTACESDMNNALTQMWMHLLTGKPVGFGDFRDIEKDVLFIVNCGQHPPYFFGGPQEDSIKKLDRVEYMGQEKEHSPAGGSAVRGRTPGGYTMTIARLARENLRYYIVSTVIETVDVSLKEHETYGLSWPIIKGKPPISGDQLARIWPANHLAFTYGDLTPHLVEMAERLNIGYHIFDAKGQGYYKPS